MSDEVMQILTQVPEMAILVFLVITFLKHMDIAEKRQAASIEKLSQSIDDLCRAIEVLRQKVNQERYQFDESEG